MILIDTVSREVTKIIMPAKDDAWVGSRAHLDDDRYHTDSDYEDEDDDEKAPVYLTRKDASER